MTERRAVRIKYGLARHFCYLNADWLAGIRRSRGSSAANSGAADALRQLASSSLNEEGGRQGIASMTRYNIAN